MPTSNQPSKLATRIANANRVHDNDYPLWQGPCADGPLGGVTQTMLGRFFSCRERFRLKYILGLEPHDKWNHRLGYGNLWHTCEEAFAARRDWVGELQKYTQSEMNKYPLQREDIAKWYEVCRVQFPEYVSYWESHPDMLNRTPLMQEQVFDVPYTLPSGRVVRLRGKWDSVDLIGMPRCNCGANLSGAAPEVHSSLCPANRGGAVCGKVTKGIWLQENKTKGDIDKTQVERQLKFDLQTMIYLIALDSVPSEVKWEMRYRHNGMDYPIFGVRYNVVRRPLSGGKGTIRPTKQKATKRTYTPAETASAFYERLRKDYIAKDPEHYFFRVEAEVSERDIKVFKDTCLDPLLETLCWWYEDVTGKKNYNYGWGPPMNYRTPFGIYNALDESGSTEYDAYLETGSEAGLRRVETLFPELQQ